MTVAYVACDDAETFCEPVTQRYEVTLEANRDLGSRPGIFMPAMFAEVNSLDANGDGDLTADELPEGEVTLYIGHMDYNGNEVIEKGRSRPFSACSTMAAALIPPQMMATIDVLTNVRHGR